MATQAKQISQPGTAVASSVASGIRDDNRSSPLWSGDPSADTLSQEALSEKGNNMQCSCVRSRPRGQV